MAYEFRPDSTPVLFFRPKNHVPYERGSREWFLWPVYAYRVIAPIPASRRLLNLFQKAVLGFCRAGNSNPSEIGVHLHLEPDLIDYILAELKRKNLLNMDYLPTLEGYEILREELDEAPAEVLTGYVFQDPWQQKLWPRLVEHLEFADTEFSGDELFPTLVFGTKGTPRRYRPFVKRSDGGTFPLTPSVPEILEASRRHKRDLGRSSRQDIDDDTEMDSVTGNNVESPDIQKVALIAEEPESYYLATFVYTPQNDPYPGEWYVCDPFGLGASTQLRRWMESLTQRDDLLREHIDRLLQRTTEENQSKVSDRVILENRARQEIADRVSAFAETLSFHEQLVAVARSVLELEPYHDAPPKDKLEDVMVKAGKALEALLAYVRERFPAPGSSEIYATPDWQYRSDLLNDIASGMGFRTPLPRSLTGISSQQVQRAAKSGGGTLGERLIVALLAARIEARHPFHGAARQMPDMFDRLGQLIRLRGWSAHDTAYSPTVQGIEEQVELTYQITRLLACLESPLEGERNELEEQKI